MFNEGMTMLKCEMCIGRVLRGEMSVLRSVDRSIEYEAGRAIEITDDTHRINVKVDGITVKVDGNGNLSVDMPDIYAVTAILETLSRYPLDHNYRDLRPLVPNGVNQGKWATETVGAPNKPIHLDGGVIKASSANVGTSTSPIYMNGGVLTPCSNTLDVNISGNAPKDALSQKIDETYLKSVSIASDGTITITRGDGNTVTVNTLKNLITDVNTFIDTVRTQIENDFVKRTPSDLQNNPVILYNGSRNYNAVAQGASYSSSTEYFNANQEYVNFTAVPCNNLSYDSSKTYYKIDVNTGEYTVFNATSTNWLTNRDEIFYFYDYSSQKTFEQMVANNELFTAIYVGTVADWDSRDTRYGVSYTNEDNDKVGIKHSGFVTVTGRFETFIGITDITLNKTVGYVDKKHRYGTGHETISAMLIKGHDYIISGWEIVSIGFFGD